MPAAQEGGRRRIDVFELGVAIGMRRPLAALLEGLQAVPQRVEHAPHRRRTDAPAVRAKAAVNFARLLQVQRRGEIGSPRVSGSTNASNAAATPGCVSPIPGATGADPPNARGPTTLRGGRWECRQ